MSRRLVWSALLALAFVMGLMAWLAPTAHGESARKPATIRSVSPSGIDAPDCSGSPCRHIQYAITQSSYGDRINVASGIYTEHITMTNGVSVYGTGWDARPARSLTRPHSISTATAAPPAPRWARTRFAARVSTCRSF